MKLLSKTFRYYLLVSIPIFLLSSTSFYFILRYIMIQQVDESLREDKLEILEFLKNDEENVTELYKNIRCSYYLTELKGNAVQNDRYGFVYEYDYDEKEYEPYREYRTWVEIQGKKHEMVLQVSFVETDSMIYSISIFSIILFGLLVPGMIFFIRIVSKNIWQPFYESLKLLENFDPNIKPGKIKRSTDILEFDTLNKILEKMTIRLASDFDQQKSFIENISHELQNPIAVESSKLELFIQKAEFNEETAKIVSDLDGTIEKIKNICKSLLLLSRIKNEQFSDKEIVEVNEIITEYLEDHEEGIELKEIEVSIQSFNTLKVLMNKGLAEILIGNLLKNAIVHNEVSGEIVIDIKGPKLTIRNTGYKTKENPEKLFDKYISSGSLDESIGLGLPIIKEICKFYRFDFDYKIIGKLHVFKIEFITYD